MEKRFSYGSFAGTLYSRISKSWQEAGVKINDINKKRGDLEMAKQPAGPDLKVLFHYNRPKSTPTVHDNPSYHENDVIPRSSSVTFGNSSESIPERRGSADGQVGTEITPLLETSSRRDSDIDSVFSAELKESVTRYFTFSNHKQIFQHVKIAALLVLTAVFCGIIAVHDEHEHEWNILAINSQKSRSTDLEISGKQLRLYLDGPLKTAQNISDEGPPYSVTAELINDGKNKTEKWTLMIDHSGGKPTDSQLEHLFEEKSNSGNVTIRFSTNSPEDVTLRWHALPKDNAQIVWAAVVLAFVYLLIIFDLVHRTLAAMIGSMAALAVLSAYDRRPSLEAIISWIDMETLMLLFGMMVLVAIFSETGFFNFFALKAYKTAKGKVWSLITLLCIFSAVVSAFLDNVTTILLLTPVTIRLCEVLNLDPRRILIAEVLFSNIGGTATAVGDPPNVIIVSNKEMLDKGIDFASFTLHMFVGIVFTTIAGYGLLRVYYRNLDALKNKDPPEISDLKHEITMWKRAANRVSVVTREESIMKALFLQKSAQRENTLIRQLYKMRRSEIRSFQQNVQDLERKYFITDQYLLVKTSIVLFVVILFFFLQSFISNVYLNIGWVAVMGAILLLILADTDDMETILHKVEWATLIFFAALFVLMEALKELQLIDWIGDQVSSGIQKVDEDSRLVVAILIIVWVSAIASSFIDNIPYTTAMVPILLRLSDNENLNLDLLPLTFALAFGACLGGNGTLIGASANVVCAGIAEQHGYGFSFLEFFKQDWVSYDAGDKRCWDNIFTYLPPFVTLALINATVVILINCNVVQKTFNCQIQ